MLFEKNSEGLKPLTPTGPQLHLFLFILVVLVSVPVATLLVLSSAHIVTDVATHVRTHATSLVSTTLDKVRHSTGAHAE